MFRDGGGGRRGSALLKEEGGILSQQHRIYFRGIFSIGSDGEVYIYIRILLSSLSSCSAFMRSTWTMFHMYFVCFSCIDVERPIFI